MNRSEGTRSLQPDFLTRKVMCGDNDLVTDDSRAYGVADVVGRVVLRYWPRPARISYRQV